MKATFRQPGVPRAALGYYRCAFDLRAAANRDARALGRRRLEIPVQILMGRRDGCMDVRLAEAALDRRQFDAGVHLELIDGAGHFLHLERPAHVSRLLTDFIQSSGR